MHARFPFASYHNVRSLEVIFQHIPLLGRFPSPDLRQKSPSVKDRGSSEHGRRKTALRDHGKGGTQTDDATGQRFLMTLCYCAVATTAAESPPSQAWSLHCARPSLAGRYCASAGVSYLGEAGCMNIIS